MLNIKTKNKQNNKTYITPEKNVFTYWAPGNLKVHDRRHMDIQMNYQNVI